jgi:hypothetical protein
MVHPVIRPQVIVWSEFMMACLIAHRSVAIRSDYPITAGAKPYQVAKLPRCPCRLASLRRPGAVVRALIRTHHLSASCLCFQPDLSGSSARHRGSGQPAWSSVMGGRGSAADKFAGVALITDMSLPLGRTTAGWVPAHGSLVGWVRTVNARSVRGRGPHGSFLAPRLVGWLVGWVRTVQSDVPACLGSSKRDRTGARESMNRAALRMTCHNQFARYDADAHVYCLDITCAAIQPCQTRRPL